MFVKRFFSQITAPPRDYIDDDDDGKSKAKSKFFSATFKGRRVWFVLATLIIVSLTCFVGMRSLQAQSSTYVYAPPSKSIFDISSSSSLALVETDAQATTSKASKLTFVYEMIACGCGGFQTEIVDIVLGLYYAKTVRRLAIQATPGCFCPGYPQEIVDVLEHLRTQPYQQWDIDVFVRHAGPTNMIPKWPYLDIPRRPKVVVGRTMVEIDRVIPDWLKHLDHVDDVWVPSRHSLEAFTKAGADEKKFGLIQEPIEASLYDPSKVVPLPIKRRKFTFLSIFKWESRKGVDTLLRAFFEEFTADDEVSLIISTHLYGADNEYQPDVIRAKVREYVEQIGLDAKPNALPLDRVIVISERLPTVDMLRLYKTADAFVMPTHGEGWGLPIVEAMMMERPTIATDYSGIREYLTPEVGFPIRTKGLESAMGRGFEHWMEWASVDLRHLKHLMRKVTSMTVAERHTVGRRARQHIMGKFSRRAIADQIKGRLEHLVDKFNLEGSARKTCLREYKAERARARSLGVLGAAYKPADSADSDVVADRALAAASGALTGAEDYVARVCTLQGPRDFYRQWEGRMLAQYQYWPPHEPIDAMSSVDDGIYEPSTAAWDQRKEVVGKLKASAYASARNVYLTSLPESIVPTAADSDPWEVRRAREKLLEEMRPQAEVERERKRQRKREEKRRARRDRELKRLEAERREIEEAERVAKAQAEAAKQSVGQTTLFVERGAAKVAKTIDASAPANAKAKAKGDVVASAKATPQPAAPAAPATPAKAL